MDSTIALFGGSFNPIHVAHLAVARAAMEALGLERLVLVPSARPPHKPSADLAADTHRLAMCRLAAADDPRFEVSDVELRRQGPSYTVDTLADVRRRRPEASLVLLVGADMLRDLHLWHRFEEIVRLARVVTLPRPGVELGRLEPLRRALGDATADALLADVLPTPRVDVSATDIRRRIRQGLPIDGLVPPAVADYIREHRLYH
ncbi:MAG TPA: nicotinate (nicotinamide) nucleotide adenylyltransferase [Phycisphaerae bacterium]|nr:nicotinate (nicotinamide) nucleotide adenylyltransferase [Phycisphaerae bacterium]HOI54978.1 nicotinate (nicotinamide) nucleotide adenylyltransferase [Phycisphaerae bacterium]